MDNLATVEYNLLAAVQTVAEQTDAALVAAVLAGRSVVVVAAESKVGVPADIVVATERMA